MRRMSPYIYDQPDWPKFHWNREHLAERLAAVRHEQGRLLGRMESLGFKLRQEAVLQTLTDDVLKSCEIEGEYLDAEQVRSSLARRLGMDIGGLKDADRNVEGVVEMMLDATRHYDERLTAERLFAWHASMFPTGRSGMRRIRVGFWRDDSHGPMQGVSGPIGRERVHFEAPNAGRLEREMRAFLEWFNGQAETDWVAKAGLAHLWFVTIHPFDDGNGRIARAIGARALRTKFATLLQHVGPDPAGARRLLRGSGANTERPDGHHALDGLVPGLPGSGHRRRASHSRSHTLQSALLGSNCRFSIERAPASCTQPSPA